MEDASEVAWEVLSTLVPPGQSAQRRGNLFIDREASWIIKGTHRDLGVPFIWRLLSSGR